VQLSKGMRLDTSYYFWPPSWVADVPGLFTGSAMPMRFTRPDGTFIDGRATRNMDRLAIRRAGAELVVDVDTLYQADDNPKEWAAAFVPA